MWWMLHDGGLNQHLPAAEDVIVQLVQIFGLFFLERNRNIETVATSEDLLSQ